MSSLQNGSPQATSGPLTCLISFCVVLLKSYNWKCEKLFLKKKKICSRVFLLKIGVCFFMAKKMDRSQAATIPPLEGDGARAIWCWCQSKHAMFEMLIPTPQILLPYSSVNPVCQISPLVLNSFLFILLKTGCGIGQTGWSWAGSVLDSLFI